MVKQRVRVCDNKRSSDRPQKRGVVGDAVKPEVRDSVARVAAGGRATDDMKLIRSSV